ncbi:semaphorin-7A [Paroedura picta]|uniref:semaphorin-7A n=1 Tax=Paroedura picta TaxID=143630 RepID=UPI00405706DA
MRLERAAALLLLCAWQLPVLLATFWTARPRILAGPAAGGKRFSFTAEEKHVTLYHENGSSSVYVGAVNKLYHFNFEDENDNSIEPFNVTESQCTNSTQAENYLTLVAKFRGKLLVCGSNGCSPTCWNWANNMKESSEISPYGVAPFNLDQNSFVLFYEDNIFSAISRNGRNQVRFRRVRGPRELYTGDNLWNSPKLIQGAIIKNKEAYLDKIYLFFQEDNPEWVKNPEAPNRISRVAQLCVGDGGGPGALSATKWSTFLKSTMHCFGSNTDHHFHLVQDVFVVRSDDWAETKLYGLFSNEWGYSAVCVYSVVDITKIFETSPLLDFTGGFPGWRPGLCIKGSKPTPSYTYKVANSNPEVLQRVKPRNMLFHNKHQYQKIVVHSVQAADEETYNVLYLATESGTIHKVVNLHDGPMNILEIQPFQNPAAIKSMVLDSTRNVLLVASETEVVELPTAMCAAYEDNCASCVLARDPYCGWAAGKCISVYDSRNLLQSLTYEVPQEICASSLHNDAGGASHREPCKNATQFSRYYLNCSLASHHATYSWVHRNNIVAHCNSGTDPCTYFIDRVSLDSTGNYTCISQEQWFKQTRENQCLTVWPEREVNIIGKELLHFPQIAREGVGLSAVAGNRATAASFSFWLELLHVVAIFAFLN